ncbi:DinB family protein [Chloroflexota bacterium]
METKDFILDMLNHMQRTLDGALDGLTHDELKWQPNPEANSIGFTLWHQIRCEDGFLVSMIQQKPQVWISGKWYQKMGMSDDPQDSGWGYTAEQVTAFPVPELKVLVDYGEAVRAKTVEFLKAATPEKMEEKVETGIFGEMTVTQIFSFLLCELILHTGHIAYIRGLKRGINK